MNIPVILYLWFDSWLPLPTARISLRNKHTLFYTPRSKVNESFFFLLNSSENDNKTNDVKNIEIIFLLSGIIEVLLGFILPSEVLKQKGHGGEQNGKPEQDL